MAWTYEILGEASESMELQICDAIGDATKGVTSSAVRDAFKANKNAKAIVVNLHSAGGEVLEGLEIFNLLASHPARVLVKIPTLAASIASIIAMAGDEIEIGRGAFMMIHNPYAQTKGGSEDLRKLADVLDKMRDSMVAIYAKRSGKRKETILKMMEEETWMTGAEAVKQGFADKLVDGPRKAVASDQLKIYAKVPDEVLQITAPGLSQAQSQVETTGENMDKELEKKLADLFSEFEKKMDAKYGKSAKATEEEEDEDEDEDEEELPEGKSKGEAELPSTQAQASAEASVLTALVEANKMVAELNAKLDAQNKVAFATRVSKAVADGKLLPTQKAWALKQTEKAFDDYLAAVGDATFPVGKEHEGDEKAALEHAKATVQTEDLTAEEKKLAKNMGISEAEVIAYNKAHPRA